MSTKNRISLAKQYQKIVDETNIVTKTNTKGIITYVNSKFIDISGFSEEELIGKSHNIVRNPDNPASLYKKLWDTIRSKNVWHGKISNMRRDGSKYTVDASIFPILDSNGEIIEYISIRHDITELLELSDRLEKINIYNAQQEYLAKDKLEAGIVNDLNDDEHAILRLPSDILSGDFHSIYKMDDGSIFLYLIDGQGHGISPALTVFAISSMLNKYIKSMPTIKDLIQTLYPEVKTFLSEFEQLSYIMIKISPDKKHLTYASGGMYPFLIKSGDEIMRVKANNTPFMNFSEMPVCEKIEIDNWDSIILYSDGIIEHDNEDLNKYTPEFMIKNSLTIKETFQKISLYDFDDDVSIIYLNNFKL